MSITSVWGFEVGRQVTNWMGDDANAAVIGPQDAANDIIIRVEFLLKTTGDVTSRT